MVFGGHEFDAKQKKEERGETSSNGKEWEAKSLGGELEKNQTRGSGQTHNKPNKNRFLCDSDPKAEATVGDKSKRPKHKQKEPTLMEGKRQVLSFWLPKTLSDRKRPSPPAKRRAPPQAKSPPQTDHTTAS